MSNRFHRKLWLCGASVLLGSALLQGQEPAPSAPVKDAYVRGWAVLGDVKSKDTYALLDVPEKAKDEKDAKKVFSAVKGCYRTGFGMEYTQTVSGKRKFVLIKETPSPVKVAVLDAEFEKGAGYSLVAVLDKGTPKLGLVREFPIPPENAKQEAGISIYNLLTESPLQIQIGDAVPRDIPFAGPKAFFVPSSQISGKTVALIYSTKQRGQIRQELPYAGTGRLSAVFMRNNSSRPSVFVYPPDHNKE